MLRNGVLLGFGVVLTVLLTSGVAAAGTEVVVQTTLVDALRELAGGLESFVDFLRVFAESLKNAGLDTTLPSTEGT